MQLLFYKVETIPTVWIQLNSPNDCRDIIIGGVYRRSRESTELMKCEFDQLQQQILRASQTGKTVLVIGDINVDHNNKLHLLNKEANELLDIVEAADMRHIPNCKPTWKSYGLHKVCKCEIRNCGCPRLHRTSCIDNAYISLEADASLKVLDDAVTDHFPLLINLKKKKLIVSSSQPGGGTHQKSKDQN